MSTLKIGSLFAGYGGLDMGIKDVLDAETVWFSEFDKAPSAILAHHWPDIPNHGDITQIDWANVEPVDILTGGFPCQDVSLAGARKGLKDGTRSGLWSEFARAIETLKPRLVVIENVRGLLSAAAGGSVESDPWGVGDGATRPVVNALGAVLGDLVSLGYDAEWCGVRAADAGAPHGRYRIFIVAHPEHNGNASREGGGCVGTFTAQGGHERFAPSANVEPAGASRGGTIATATADTSGERFGEHARESFAEETRSASSDLADGAGRSRADSDRGATVADTDNSGRGEPRRPVTVRPEQSPAEHNRVDVGWGVYEPAIRRWEHLSGRVAPPPTNPDGRDGSHRLSARFVEWMMGLPVGHVTDPAIGLTRNEQLKALGNGVVPQQASLALRTLLGGRQ
jgi:DNA (cytosine-5)-methyltransferase 1